MNSSIAKYSKRIMWIHWITLTLGISQMITGTMLMDIEVSREKFVLSAFHFGSGIAVLIFTLMRVYFFFKDPRPEKPKQLKLFHKKFINIIHVSFYIVLLLLGITGLISVIKNKLYFPVTSNNADAFENLKRNPIMISHFALSKIFILLFILHIIGFFRHWIKFKENRLKTIS